MPERASAPGRGRWEDPASRPVLSDAVIEQVAAVFRRYLRLLDEDEDDQPGCAGSVRA
jgi:hypothetical protein